MDQRRNVLDDVIKEFFATIVIPNLSLNSYIIPGIHLSNDPTDLDKLKIVNDV